MLKFRTSKLSQLISSLDDLKNAQKKLSHTQNKVFEHLHEWSMEETNNTALQDVTNKFAELYSNLEKNLRQEKIESIDRLTEMFAKFKEYDSKIEKLKQATKNARKQEKKCLNEIKKCPVNKSIRDYELRHERAKQDSECAEYKSIEFSKEIDATKSILFKTNFKRYNEMLFRENEAERVLYKAMNNLIDQVPDVSNEVVDDISMIRYTKQNETTKICHQASRKLTRLSSTKIKLEEFNQKQVEVFANTIVLEAVQDSLVVPIVESAPTNRVQSVKEKIKSASSLYPSLDEIKALNESLSKFGLTDSTHSIPPPTYSDSESYYNELQKTEFDSNRVILRPSAPSPPPSSVGQLEQPTRKSVSFNLTNQLPTDLKAP